MEKNKETKRRRNKTIVAPMMIVNADDDDKSMVIQWRAWDEYVQVKGSDK